MPGRRNGTHGTPPSNLRALAENDPLLREVDVEMVAQAALFALGAFAALFALKGWVLTWM